MSAGDDRVFHYAILASIALHALILFGFSMRDAARRSPAVPAPIVARLVEPPAAAPAPPAARPEPVVPPRTEKPPPKPKPPLPVEKPVAKAPLPAPAEPPVAPAAAAEPETPAPPSAAPPSAPAAAPSAPAAQAAPSGADTDADTIARFRMQVIQAALKYKRYPRVALDNAWEGRTDVRVSFSAEGRRTSIVIVRASGHEVLDRQAIDTVTKAFVPVPPALRGKAFTFDIPVIFNLKDESSG